jgi:hypothetical protein
MVSDAACDWTIVSDIERCSFALDGKASGMAGSISKAKKQ